MSQCILALVVIFRFIVRLKIIIVNTETISIRQKCTNCGFNIGETTNGFPGRETEQKTFNNLKCRNLWLSARARGISVAGESSDTGN